MDSTISETVTSDSVLSSDPLEARELKVVERMREMSQHFTIRQVASIHDMSVPGVKAFADRHGISFHDNGGHRTKRVCSVWIDQEKKHTKVIVHRSLNRKPVVSIDDEKITPQLKELARRRDEEASNTFVTYLRDLGTRHTKDQATRIAKISPNFMRAMIYEHDLVFLGDSAEVLSGGLTKTVSKLGRTLFRPTASIPEPLSDLMRRQMINDVEDYL